MTAGVDVTVCVGVPPVPVTVAVRSAPTAELQVKVEVATPFATRVTDATGLQVRPVEGFAESETTPAKPFTEVTVTVEDPELVARMLDGETGPVETRKVGPAETETSVVLDNVLGATPVVPVTVRVN